MAYVTVPKDLTKVKTKVALNLTKRQLVCFSMAAAVGVPLFFLIKGSVPQTAATFLMVLAMLPFFLFAMYEKHGQPLEKVLGNIIKVFFLTPKERPYQTENYYAVLAKQRKLNKEVTAIAKKSYQRQTAKLAGKRENPAHTGRKKADSRPHAAGKGGREKAHRTADNPLLADVPGRNMPGKGQSFLKER